ncbi:hypothetical protein IMCC3317_36640 [Kordia antarctica]|uniref:DUF4230 domain-containing protein n=1 Tax=Kordia antarctica TaxID=1218801 RepID=A0A7L4ZQV3_9FLAO|nr:DUF4230 domain-containing protein [Kordia antarctica]QHI38274.1 hypothetical protein IMCC3317_36640 [Kordia antarctica]
MDIVLAVLIGGIVSYFLYDFIGKRQSEKRTIHQSQVLIDKIKSVCRLTTVEGDFSEIYHYEDKSAHFLRMLFSKKRALIVIKAKASVGYDLKKLRLESDKDKKQVRIIHFPQPEILTVETDFTYYDKKDGLLNKFSAEDLTKLNKEAKQHIIDKVPQSGLLESAKKEALDAILIIEKIVETIGWELDYSEITLPEEDISYLKKN